MQNSESLEPRYEKDALRPKDVMRWSSGNSAKEVHQVMQNHWNVYSEPPAVRSDYQRSGIDKESFKNGYVVIGIKDIEIVRRLFEKTGRKMSCNDLLRSMLAGRTTAYIMYHHVPKNFEPDFSFSDSENCTPENFRNYVSVDSQVRAISNIGTRAIERHSGVYDPAMDRAAVKFSFEEGEERSKINLKRLGKIVESISKKGERFKLKSKKKIEKGKHEMMDKTLNASLAGTATVFTTDHLEKRFEGRFPQLIMRTLEPEETYVEYFKRFVGEYMPSFEQILRSENLI